MDEMDDAYSVVLLSASRKRGPIEVTYKRGPLAERGFHHAEPN